jgi:hypothetical protein
MAPRQVSASAAPAEINRPREAPNWIAYRAGISFKV